MNPILVITALLTFALLCLPGWILAARHMLALGPFLASGVASVFAVLTATALLSEMIGYLPAWAVIPVAIAFSFLICLYKHDGPVRLPPCTPVLIIVPALMVLHAWFAYRVGFGIDNNPAVFRAWYNADWFKHLGHAHSLSNFGLPAQDIFGGGDRLHYYWLFYILPGSIGSLFDESARDALLVVNLILVFVFWMLLISFLLQLGSTAFKASIIAIIGWTIFTMEGFITLIKNQNSIWEYSTNNQVGSGLLTALNTFIPQHLFMLSGLLTFGLIWCAANKNANALRFIACLPIIASGAVSTLMGVSVTIIACSLIFLDSRETIARKFVIIAMLGVATLSLTFILQIVDISIGRDTLSSPAFESMIDPRSYTDRAKGAFIRHIVLFGLAVPLGWLGLARGLKSKNSEHRMLITFSLLMALVGIVATMGSDIVLDSKRIVKEVGYRNGYLISFGYLVGISLVIDEIHLMGRERYSFIVLLLITIIISLPSNVMNFIWQGWSQSRWQVEVPNADMRALRYLRRASSMDALVLQYPEAPFVVDQGRDTWVPIFAGRRIPGSYRSTRWSSGEPQVRFGHEFFDRLSTHAPAGIDWIYLSRTLHPSTYDQLKALLQRDVAWRQRYCEADACLFSRRLNTEVHESDSNEPYDNRGR